MAIYEIKTKLINKTLTQKIQKTLTQKKDGIKEKRSNPLYSDNLKHKKSNTNLKGKTSESNTLANTSTTIGQLKTLKINNKVNKITIKISFIYKPK